MQLLLQPAELAALAALQVRHLLLTHQAESSRTLLLRSQSLLRRMALQKQLRLQPLLFRRQQRRAQLQQ